MKILSLIIFFNLVFISEKVDSKTFDPLVHTNWNYINNIFFQKSDPDVNTLSRTYGYLRGQQYSLDKIASKFPNLKMEVKRCELEFSIAFGKGAERVTTKLKDLMGTKFFEFDKILTDQFASLLKDEDFNYEASLLFLEEVKNRAKGDIESPVFEMLLTYQFIDIPATEFAKGFTGKYATKDHPKAKGISMTLKLPLSWSQNEGDRPNIVQKFRSENGNGGESILILIKDFPDGYIMSKEEINEFFNSENEMKGMVPEDSEFLYGKKIVIDRQLGGEIAIRLKRQRMDYNVKMQGVQFVTIYKNKFVMCQCFVNGETDTELTEKFNKFLPLFRQVANSIIFMDQY